VRLLDSVIAKVGEAIGELPIMSIERDSLDWEVAPMLAPAPGGGGEFLVMYSVSLFAPCGTGDHATHTAIIPDPYCAQYQVNAMMRDLLAKIQEEQDKARKAAAAALNGGPAL